MSLAVAQSESVMDVRAWLADHADALDLGSDLASEVLPRLAAAGCPRIGVPVSEGGDGGDTADAMAMIADVAEYSLAAAFVLWSQRSYIEYLRRSDNAALRTEQMPELLAGHLAGVSGLSNAIKHLAGLESLALTTNDTGNMRIDGRLPWVTNARPGAFAVAVATQGPQGTAAVVALRHDDPGVRRGADLDLMALRGSFTTTLDLHAVPIRPERIIHADLRAWLPGIRPALIGMQAGLAIGLARRCLAEAGQAGGSARGILAESIAGTDAGLRTHEAELAAGLRDGRFVGTPQRLFQLRIALAEVVRDAVNLELQAKGGRAFVTGADRGFARRWREAAFIPIVTPSVVQLTAMIAREGQGA